MGRSVHNSIHVDVRNLGEGGCKALLGVEAFENPYFRCLEVLKRFRIFLTIFDTSQHLK